MDAKEKKAILKEAKAEVRKEIQEESKETIKEYLHEIRAAKEVVLRLERQLEKYLGEDDVEVEI